MKLTRYRYSGSGYPVYCSSQEQMADLILSAVMAEVSCHVGGDNEIFFLGNEKEVAFLTHYFREYDVDFSCEDWIHFRSGNV